ncbi:MAG TPA: hypothetical protein VNY08_13110 [Bradyrhizobium sp.]|jgi:hypothetical protein|nr:hypothetical protein [Bradyrhizobium sp.]
MALHRDIYWVGRQWAVTGVGVQAVDQRLKGAFDIEVARLWDDDLPQRMRGLAWINIDDFNKALEVAHARFPAPPRKSLPLVESVLELIQPAPAAPAKTIASSPTESSLRASDIAPVELPKPNIPLLALRMERATAKFLPQWRVKR